MATLTLLNKGVENMGKLFLNNGPSTGNLALHLYTNNHAPVVTDTGAAFTECTATGYSAVTLTGASWTGTTSAGVFDYTYPAVTFTFTAGLGQTVYGCYLTDAAGDVVSAGLLDTAFAIPAGGGSIVVNLEHQQKQC